jgi:hypothetical protein
MTGGECTKNVEGGYGEGQFMGFLPMAPAQLAHY